MKLRAGFVSNSSTCSFQIFGIVEDMNEIRELLVEKWDMPEVDDDEQVNGEWFDEGEWFDHGGLWY